MLINNKDKCFIRMGVYDNHVSTAKRFFINYSLKKPSISKKGNSVEKIKSFPYLEKIKNIRTKNTDIFELNIDQFYKKKFPIELRWIFKSNTKRFLTIIENAIFQLIDELFPLTSFQSELKVFGKNDSEREKNPKNFSHMNSFQITLKPGKKYQFIRFQNIGANLIGKFIMLHGRVVELISQRIFIKKAVYRCFNCNQDFFQEIKNNNFKPFFRCPSKICKIGKSGGNLFLNTSSTIFQKIQEIKIQENTLDKQNRKLDQTIRVKIVGNNLKTFLEGDLVDVAGTLIPIPIKKNKYYNFIQSLFIESFYIEPGAGPFFLKKKDTKKEKEIIKLFFTKNIYNRISESFAPLVQGNLNLKKALVLSTLIEPVETPKNYFNFRNGINILILGETCMAKTRILKSLLKINSNSYYANSFENLGNLIPKEMSLNDEFHYFSKKKIQALKSRISIVCFDNLERFQTKDVFFLKNCLETQSIPKNVNWGEKERKSILSFVAAATLEKKFFLRTKEIDLNFKFFELFSKFQLLFILPENNDFFGNEKLAKHLLSNYKESGKIKKNIKISILKSYLLESRKIFPNINQEVFDILIHYYLSWKSVEKEEFGLNINIKTISLIFQLGLSLARLKFQKYVSKKEIKEIIRLIEFSKKNQQKISDSFIFFENENKKQCLYRKIRDCSIFSKNHELKLSFLESFLIKKGFTREDFVACLGFYEDLNVWKINISSGKLTFLG